MKPRDPVASGVIWAAMAVVWAWLCLAQPGRGQTRISAMPTAAPLTGPELVPIVQNAANAVTTPSALLTYIQAHIGFTGDCSVTSEAITCTKTGGVAFTAPATAATTGSGNVVLATSPTLVTPTLGAATANSIVTNATITGSLSAGAFSYGTLPYADTGLLGSFNLSTNGYAQWVLSNPNTGTSASADFIVNNNNSTATTYYGDFGINGANFSGTGSLGLGNATYLYAASGDLALGTSTSNAIHLVAGGGATDALTITTGNLVKLPGLTATSVVCDDGAEQLTSACGSATPSFGATSVAGLTDSGLTASLPVCTNASKALSTGSSCTLSAEVYAYPNGASPATFSQTSAKMLGLASANCTAASSGSACFATEPIITPAATGRVMVTITRYMQNGTAGHTFNYQGYYGSGAAPATAATVIGTAIGASLQGETSTGGDTVPITFTGVVTGLTVGTAYWFDLAVYESAGTTTATQFTVTLTEF